MSEITKATLQGRLSHTIKSNFDTTRAGAGGQNAKKQIKDHYENDPQTNSFKTVGYYAFYCFFDKKKHGDHLCFNQYLSEEMIPYSGNYGDGAVRFSKCYQVANMKLAKWSTENFVHSIEGYAHFWTHPQNGHWGCTPLPHTPEISRSFSRCSYVSNGRLNFEPTDLIQPFGSIPRDCSSLRIIRLIHADTDASPSCASACLMPSSKPGSTRNAICLLPLPLISMVDIWLTPDYFEVVIKCMTSVYQKATPRTVRAVPRRLTKPLIEVTVMAESQHTQTHPKFTWRFLALSTLGRNVIHITASTEREARELSPIGCVMVFAGRLPVQEVHHA